MHRHGFRVRRRVERLPLHIGLFLLYLFVSLSLSSSSPSTPFTSGEAKVPINGSVPTTTVAHGTAKEDVVDSPYGSTEGPDEEERETSSWVTPNPTERITIRPPRETCTAPAIEQFPMPWPGPWARKHGALVIHLAVAIYTFLGLAVVCDDYFVVILDRIREELKLPPDVAGVTFMAAGSSAPQLVTLLVGVFFAKDDIGVSGVMGSAVFNVVFVISLCGICTTTACKLDWWPLCRDCFFYVISILVMHFIVADEFVSWYEALFMLIMYVVYCVVLLSFARLKNWSKSGNLAYQQQQVQAHLDPEQQQQVDKQPVDPKPAYYKAKEADPNEVSPLVKPTDGGKWGLFTWGLVFPIHFTCRVTMPDCRQDKYRNWYPLTFCISILWISFYSYFMVWMITIIGHTLGIPDSVMGLTFVAAGMSVPNAFSSLAVAKQGLGDMAVSNAVGSNVFDILVCLGLPWFIQTAMVQPGSHVNVISKGLIYSTIPLLSTVVFLVVATLFNGWKLDRRHGIVLMIWCLIFTVLASLYELNVFGVINPATCPSMF